MSKSEEKSVKGSSKSVKSSTPGGHSGHGVPMQQRNSNNTNSARSRANRTRWDWSDGSLGGDMPYQYKEYPKHVYTDPTNRKNWIEVNSEDEERLVLGGEEVIDEEHERHRLLTVASINKVQVDKRWGPAKITKAIEDAGFDPTSNPFK